MQDPFNIACFFTQDPYTHIYMFCRGFPTNNYVALGKAFNQSVSAEFLVCCQPENFVKQYFEVDFVHAILTHMHGSGQTIRFYFYKRTDSARKYKYHELCVPFLKESNDTMAGLEGMDPFADPVLADASRLAFADNDTKLSVLREWSSFWQQTKSRRSAEAITLATNSSAHNELEIESFTGFNVEDKVEFTSIRDLKSALGPLHRSLISDVNTAFERLVQSAVNVKNSVDVFELHTIEFILISVDAFRGSKKKPVNILKYLQDKCTFHSMHTE